MRTRKSRAVGATLGAFALLLAACGGSGDDAGAEPTAAEEGDDGGDQPGSSGSDVESVSLDFSTQSVPDDHHTQAIHRFAEEVETLTDGRLTINVHDSGSLMDQNTEQDAIQRGDVDMIYTSPQWVEGEVPEVGIVGVPYLIEDVEHLYAVHDGDVGAQLYELVIEQLGIRPITSMYLGTRQLNLTDSVDRVETPDDLAGVNLRVPDADAWIDMGQALGANPTPVAFGELYLALETGTVDGQDNPLPTTRNATFFEVTSQVVLTGHLVNDVWPTINEEVWQSLDTELQQAIVDAWMTARDFGTETALANEDEASAFFQSEGLEVYEPDVDAFRDHVLDIYLNDEARTSQWIDGMADAIQELAG